MRTLSQPGFMAANLRPQGRAIVRSRLVVEALPQSMIESVAHHANVVATLAEDSVITAAASATGAAVTTATDAAVTAVARSNSGPFDALAVVFENVLELLNDLLEKAHVPYSYGFAIIALTVLVKAATFPLSMKQVQSTVAIQALQPRIKDLQAKYASDAETLQLETAKLYRDAGVNPLAGCLPTLATIPVFIGLYRALTLAAEDNLLDQQFFWIPSLSGPVSLASQAAGTGLAWLFPFVDGHPPIGWGPAVSYLVLPVLLVVSQYASQRIISPPQQDANAGQAQAILKFLPLMIGWFSLNVPAGLTLYWFVNNLLSTGQQVYLKNTTKINIPDMLSTTPPGVMNSTSTPYVSPKEEKVKRPAGKDVQARRRRDGEDVVDVEAETVSSSMTSNGNGNGQAKQEGGSRGKGDKFRARKARDAAAKAASVAGGSSEGNGQATKTD